MYVDPRDRLNRIKRESNQYSQDVQQLTYFIQLLGYLSLFVIPSASNETRKVYTSVSQPPGRGPVPGPGINYTGPREVLELVVLVF